MLNVGLSAWYQIGILSFSMSLIQQLQMWCKGEMKAKLLPETLVFLWCQAFFLVIYLSYWYITQSFIVVYSILCFFTGSKNVDFFNFVKGYLEKLNNIIKLETNSLNIFQYTYFMKCLLRQDIKTLNANELSYHLLQ